MLAALMDEFKQTEMCVERWGEVAHSLRAPG